MSYAAAIERSEINCGKGSVAHIMEIDVLSRSATILASTQLAQNGRDDGAPLPAAL